MSDPSTTPGVPEDGTLILDDCLAHEEMDIYLKVWFKDLRWNLPMNVEVERDGEKGGA